MYSTCLYCNAHLGRNEVLETFPVGRRLAFDQARGRLWVVCRKCEKWNLTPFEERWEAIEDSERLFRDARKRVASENIGLARLNEGLELVRIGGAQRPEFAAWRYGDQFGRRRRRAIMLGTGAAVAGGGLIVAGAMTGVLSGGGYGIWQMISGIYRGVKRRRLVAYLQAPSGERLTVRGRHVEKARLLPASGGEGWRLELPHGDRQLITLEGDAATRAVARIMPSVNSGGGSGRRVKDAVSEIESVGDPARFMDHVSRWQMPKRRGTEVGGPLLSKLELPMRLAVEMAVNEEKERIALEGELALLELEWKEAEELAAIADRLGTPEEIEQQLEALRCRMSAHAQS